MKEKYALLITGIVLVFIGWMTGGMVQLIGLQDTTGLPILFVIAGIIAIVIAIVWIIYDK
ncbi:hypothetical protein [Nitrososphaera viennensis]|uniref:Uncharacterized protein n=2 Tax=Nitrososphaera viennensis TaxID=1034015 RepID=A0A060HLK1_9ARCH|nr:hypothetical protein [Nitrososphaera viennensis]AIC14441.1 hypothetical protein NVIE_002550 [Nitrososphaera viennensis EN76]UVS69421.1 hypothetical protein NWT39_01215 [Nitrososphaera viennensis]